MTSATQYVKYYDNFSGKMVTTDSTTGYGYDWQDRQTCVVNPPNAQGDITYTTSTYDNLDEVTDTEQYLAASLNYNGDESTYWPAAGGIAVGGVPANSYTMTDEDASGTDQSSVIASWVPGTVLTFINAATGDVVSTFTISENIAFGHNTDANDMSDGGAYLIGDMGGVADLDKLDVTIAYAIPGGGSDRLLSWTHTSYDSNGQVYQTAQYAVDPFTGDVEYLTGNSALALVSNTWYDRDGNVVMSQSVSSNEFTKTAYDGLGNAVGTYTGYDPDMPTIGTSAAYTEAEAVSSNDVITEETTTDYDAAGNPIFTTDYGRLPRASVSDTGPLDQHAADARITYEADWYDGIGREIANANYGDTAMTVADRPAAAPVWMWDNSNATWQDPSGTTIGAQVTGTAYNAAGQAWQTRDPMGYVSEDFYDAAGNTIKTIQDYVSGGTGADQNVTTYDAYTDDGQVASETNVDPSLGSQTTVGAENVPVNLGNYSAGATIYLMYGPDLGTQLGLTGRHFVPVYYNGTVWQYDNGTTLGTFAPSSGDVLVASIALGNSPPSTMTITPIAQVGDLEHVQYSGGGTIAYAYVAADEEFTVGAGSFIIPSANSVGSPDRYGQFVNLSCGWQYRLSDVHFRGGWDPFRRDEHFQFRRRRARRGYRLGV